MEILWEKVNGAEATVDNDISRGDNSVTGVNSKNISFNGNSYGKSVHMQFLMKENNKERHNIIAYKTVKTDVMNI